MSSSPPTSTIPATEVQQESSIDSTFSDIGQVKLEASAVEQLVLAAAASLPTPTNTTAAVSETPTESVSTTPNLTTSTPQEIANNEQLGNLHFSNIQLNAEQAQAIAAAAAVAVMNPDYQQLFANLEAMTGNTSTSAATASSSTTTTTRAGPPKKKEVITQKVRQENRERKKRWRQQNQERNKDNDLRCRVNKRAIKLFGKEDSEHKKKWVQDEFEKRRSKRKEKEDRKYQNDSNHTIQEDQAVQQQQQQQVAALNGLLNDPTAYISLLANQLAAATSAAEAHLQQTNDNKDDIAVDVKSDQFTTQLLEFLQQQQQIQQQEFEAVLKAASQHHQMTSGEEESKEVPPTTTIAASDVTNVNEEEANQDTKMTEAVEAKTENDDEKQVQPQETTGRNGQKMDLSMDAVMTLMQLNHGWRQ